MLEICLSSLKVSLVGFSLDALKEMPNSTIFIFLISLAINLLLNLGNRLATDIKEYREWTIKSTLLRRELMKAIQSGNKRLVEKLQKDQQESMKIQTKITKQRMKILLFFLIPFFAFWQIMGPFYGSNPVVAFMPFNAPFFGTELNYFWWYFFSSIATNITVSRLLGLTFEI